MRLVKKLGFKLVGSEDTIIWQRSENLADSKRGLVHRIPNKIYSDMRKIKSFGVRDYERCLFYNSGVLQAVLEGGIYEVEKEARNSTSEIIWVDTGIIELSWGIPHFQGIMTSEMVKIGMNGSLKIRVSEPSAFITRVVAYQKHFTDESAKNFIIKSIFITSLRDVVKNYTLTSFLRANREDIKALTRTKLSQEFQIYGLELIAIDIIGYAFPPEIQDEVDTILGESRADLTNLRSEKERVESSIIKSKIQLEELEEQYTDGKIQKDDFDTREKRFQNIISRRQSELKEVQTKINLITKDD